MTTSLARLPALAPLLFPCLLAAQVPPDTVPRDTTVFRVGEIIVQAARPVTTTGGASAIEVRLDSLVLPAAPTLEQVLREVPMVHVRTNSRGEAEIAVRGSESRQVAVLVDGVPLTLGWDARTDVSVIPATAPRTLTLVRGLSSVLHGPNVLGGVIEVGIGHGRAYLATPVLEVRGSVDHVGGTGTSITATLPRAGSHGALLVRAGLGYRDAPGLPLAPGITQEGNEDELRTNTDVRQIDGFFSLRQDWDAGPWLSVSASGFRAERGIAPELGVSEPRLWRYPDVSRAIAVLSGGTGEHASPLGGRADIEASLGLDRGRIEIDQYDSLAYRDVIAEEDGDDRTWTLRVLADQTVAGRGELRTAFTLADIRHEERLVPGGEYRYRQRLWSAGGELLWRVARAGPFRDLRLTAGGALDGADTPESGDKPALRALHDWGVRTGVTAAFAGGRALAHAGVSRRARFPSLRELYSGALGRFEPNPALEPERLTAWEAGITARRGRAELQVVGFHHRLADAIVRITTPAQQFQRVNRDQVRSTGIELLGGARVGIATLGADLTWQDVALRAEDGEGSRRPEHQPRWFGSVHGRTPLPAGLTLGARARYTGTQYCLDPETGSDRRLAAGTRTDADIAREWRMRGRRWPSRLEARFAVDNVLAATTYDQCALPQPGRLARLQLRLH